jgi:hypothetical protein
MSIAIDHVCLWYGYSTGKRTKTGAFEDLTKSMMRYFKNNYMDGSRQDGFDLALGVYRVSSISWEDSPYNMETPLMVNMVSQSGVLVV